MYGAFKTSRNNVDTVTYFYFGQYTIPVLRPLLVGEYSTAPPMIEIDLNLHAAQTRDNKGRLNLSLHQEYLPCDRLFLSPVPQHPPA